MEYATLEQAIDANIIPFNNAQLITGEKLNIVLHSMVEELGQGYQYMGLVSPSSPAITTDGKVFVIAVTEGTYTNYGGLTVADGEVAILKYGTSWTKEHITYGLTSALREKLTSLPTAAEISASLTAKLNKPSGVVVGGTIPVFTEDGNGLVSTGYTEDYYAPQYLIGDLDDLTTEEKDEIVAAINEIVARIATLAEKDGYYPDMRVGLADNVSGSTATAEEFVNKMSDADGFAEIASIKGQSAVSRNLWDEQWEVGSLDSDGSNYPSTTRIRGKNYIPCLPNKDYYILSSEICDIHFYTKDKVHIDGRRQIRNNVFTTPSYAAYIRFCEAVAYGTTYKHDICINKSDPSFNGQYEPYWEGIRSFHGTAIKTTGLNLWDEQWELGSINPSTGEDYAINRIRSKGYIPIIPSVAYWGHNVAMFAFYDANKNFISSAFPESVREIAAPNNARYMRFHTQPDYGTTYNNDICINISGARNGQYEPYKESILALPELPEGGLRSAGSAYDELTPTKNITRIGVVDLGLLNWTVQTDNIFYATIHGILQNYSANTLLPGYDKRYDIYSSWGAFDKCYGTRTGYERLYIKDTAYSDAAAFKAAMSGVMLFYELATPTEVSVPTRNLIYKTYEGGTESVIPSDMPIKADIIRSVNLPKDFISKISFDKFCTALGTAIGKTITATWDAASKTYNFTIV